ncbi:MAG TPA: response regulator [Caulobacterales bacterium]|nr:response regulator [Caulobacterales bacterium]
MIKPRPLAVVIDDDPEAAEALALTLRDWGADVVIAGNAAEALAQLGGSGEAVCWIITDFELDGANGVDDVVPLVEASPWARVLVLSGAMRFAEAADRAGFDKMSKPASADHILAWIEKR